MATVGTTDTRAATAAAAPGVVAPHIGGRTSLTALASTIFRSARDVVVHTFEVAALESRVAGTAIATIAGLAFAILILALSTWGLLLAAGVRGLMALGLGVGTSLLIVAAVNVALAVVMGLLIPRLARKTQFPATRRLLNKMGSDS